MKPSQLRSLLNLIEELFPTPERDSFRGHHHILMEDGCLTLGLWVQKNDGKIVHQKVILGRGDDDTPIEDSLPTIKKRIEEKIAACDIVPDQATAK